MEKAERLLEMRRKYELDLQPFSFLDEIDWLMITAIDSFDEATMRHSIKTLQLAVELAEREQRLPTGEIIVFLNLMERSGISYECYCRAALFHDIGKIMIPIEVLNKPGPHTHQENAVIAGHEEYSAKILMAYDRLMEGMIAAQHHNYQRRKKEIKFYIPSLNLYVAVADLIHLVDVQEALLSERTYKSGLNLLESLCIMVEQAWLGKVSKEATCLWVRSELKKINFSRLDWQKNSVWQEIYLLIRDFLHIEIGRIKRRCVPFQGAAMLTLF